MKTSLPKPPRRVTSWLQPYRFDNIVGSIELRWNQAINAWTINLFNSAGVHAAGPIVVNSASEDLWCAFHHLPSVPPGRLVCEADEHIPTRYAWTESARLVYDNG